MLPSVYLHEQLPGCTLLSQGLQLPLRRRPDTTRDEMVKWHKDTVTTTLKIKINTVVVLPKISG